MLDFRCVGGIFLQNGYIGMFSYQNLASLRIFIFHCCWERFLHPNPIVVMFIISWNDPTKCNTTTSNALQCTLYTWFRQFKCAKLSFLRRQKPAMCVSVPFPGPSLNMTASISSSPGRIRLRQKCLKTTSPNPSKSFEYDLKTVVLIPKPQIIRGTISTISLSDWRRKTTSWKELEKHVVLFCNPQKNLPLTSQMQTSDCPRAELPSCSGIYRRFRQRFRCSGGYRIGSCERRCPKAKVRGDFLKQPLLKNIGGCMCFYSQISENIMFLEDWPPYNIYVACEDWVCTKKQYFNAGKSAVFVLGSFWHMP